MIWKSFPAVSSGFRSALSVVAAAIFVCLACPVSAYDGVPVGARPLAMGEAFSAVSGDANCLQWNPAALAYLTHKEFNSMYANLYDIELKNSYLTYASPWGDNAGVGVDWSRVSFDDAELYYADDRMTFGLGYRLMRDASIGVGARYYNQDIKLDNSSVGTGSAWGFDLGLLYAFSDREESGDAYLSRIMRNFYSNDWYRWLGRYKFKVALTGRDINTPEMTYDSGGKGTVADPQYTFGLSAEPLEDFLVAVDVNDRYNLGCEYWWNSIVAARLGVQKDRDGDEGFIWSAGLGATYRNFQCDYSYTATPTLDPTHRFSVAWMYAFYDAMVVIDQVSVSNLYATTYKYYSNHPAGEIVLKNNSDEPYTVTVGAYIEKFMDGYTENEIEMPARSTKTIPINLVFNDAVRYVEKDEPVQIQLRIKYVSDRRTNVREISQKLMLYGINSLTWSEPLRIGAFINNKDEVVQAFVREEVLARAEHVPPYMTPNIYRAMQIYDALGAAGLSYVRDPNISLAAALGGEVAVDYVQHPRQLLLKKYGDCDDMVALYASCLENIQISTMLIITPVHIFLMFDSGLPKGTVAEADIARGLYIVREDRVWMPVECTLLGTSFTEAWREGARLYTGLFDEENVILINTARAWDLYTPPTLDPEPARAKFDPALYGELIAADDQAFREHKEEEIQSLILTWGSKLPDDASRKFYAGLLYSQAAFYDEGLAYFQEVARINPRYPGIHVNLGNLYMIREDNQRAKEEYRLAIEQDPYSSSAHMNLALMLFKEGRFDLAREHYEQAKDLDPKYRGYFIELE